MQRAYFEKWGQFLKVEMVCRSALGLDVHRVGIEPTTQWCRDRHKAAQFGLILLYEAQGRTVELSAPVSIYLSTIYVVLLSLLFQHATLAFPRSASSLP